LLREERNLSQTDLEKRTGLLRFHISRIENGHAVPKQETLEKMAAALEVPLYQLFYDPERTVGPLPLPPGGGFSLTWLGNWRASRWSTSNWQRSAGGPIAI
jgi:transcriptional regulator with XRE-family HTH domain